MLRRFSFALGQHITVMICVCSNTSVLDVSLRFVAHINRLIYYFKGKCHFDSELNISLLENLNIKSFPLYVLLLTNYTTYIAQSLRPDITVMVGWALKINYLSLLYMLKLYYFLSFICSTSFSL